MTNLEEEIKRFLALHHRGDERTEQERAEYAELRKKVTAALQAITPQPTAK